MGQPSVLLVSTASNIGGMERVVCALAANLPSSGFAATTVFPRSAGSDALLAWCRDQGVEAAAHDEVLDAAAPHSYRRALSFRRFIRQSGAAIVNLHYGDNFLSIWDVVAARSTGRKVVVSIHHPTAWADTTFRKRAMTVCGALLAHRVTTFSRATEEILRRAPIARRRLVRIPCGIAVPQWRPSRSEARRQLGIPDDLFVVGSLARLVPHKGIDVLIAALAEESLERSLLLVGGDGPLREELERSAAQAEGLHARFLGRVKEVDALLAASDVFVLPSRLEGFGLVYLEAAMHGVPSIGTRVGGIPDAIVDGETGLLVDVDDVEGLRRAIRRLYDDEALRERLGAAAERRALTELDEGTMARRFGDLFSTVISRPPRRRPARG